MRFLFLFIQLSVAENPIYTGHEQKIAQIQNEFVPQTQAEIASVTAQITDFQGFFAGTIPIERVLWNRFDAPLLDEYHLKSQLVVLQNAEQHIVSERFAIEKYGIDVATESIFVQYTSMMEDKFSLQLQLYGLQRRLYSSILLGLEQCSSCVQEKFTTMLSSVHEREVIAITNDNTHEIIQLSQIHDDIQWLQKEIILHFCIVKHSFDNYVHNTQLYFHNNIEQQTEWQLAYTIQLLQIIYELEPSENVQKVLVIAQTVHKQKNIERLEKELNTAKQFDVSGLSTVELEEQLDILQNKIESITDASTNEISSLESKIYSTKLDIVKSTLSVYSTKETTEELLNSQKQLAEARVNNIEKNSKQLIVLRELQTNVLTTESKRVEEIAKFITDKNTALQQYKNGITETNSLSSLDKNKQAKYDKLFSSIHDDIQEIQIRLHNLYVQELPLIPYNRDELVDDQLTIAYDEVKSTYQNIQKNITVEEKQLFAILLPLKDLRNDIKTKVSANAIEYVQRDFWKDLSFEWENMYFVFSYHVDKITNTMTSSSTWNLRQIQHSFGFSIYTFLGIFFWLWSRKKIHSVVSELQSWFFHKRSLGSFANIYTGNVSTHSSSQKEEMKKALFPLIFDTIVSILLLWMFTEGVYVSLLVRFFVLYFSWRMTKPLVQYLLYASPQQHQIEKAFVRGIQSFILYFFGIGIIQFILSNWLFADITVEVLNFIQQFLLTYVIWMQLGLWSEFLQQKAASTQNFPQLQQWIANRSKNWLGNRVGAVASILLLLLWLGSVLLYWIVENFPVLGSVLAKKSLEISSENILLYSHQLYAQDSDVNSIDYSGLVTEYVSKISTEFDIWSVDSRRGMLAIVGDEGMGKSEILRQVSALPISIPVTVYKTDDSIADICIWFQDMFHVSFKNIDDIISYLLQEPKQLICFDNFHHFFIRDVHGFAKLRDILSIMQATSDHHFWVISCHVHTWNFLRSTSTPLNLSIFREVVFLEPWNISKIRHFFTTQIQNKNLQLDFSNLTTISSIQGKQIAENAYWRVLTDASLGNPTIAIKLWNKSLYMSSTPNTVVVRLFPIVEQNILLDLDDDHCFVLANIILHNKISQKNIQVSLQISENLANTVCRNLQSFGIIESKDTVFYLVPEWIPWVHQTLLHKHMIN